MNYETVIVEQAEGIATITLNRPEKLNALNDTMGEELLKVLTDAGTDDSVRVIVITGAGRAFSAGADVKERFIDTWEKIKRGELNPALLPTFTRVGVSAIRRIEKPIIASINGPAVGFGCTLSLNCDIRIASEAARFGLVFVRMGVTPEFGSTYFLPRLVGMAKALELLFTGRIFDAKEAKEIGMVNQVVPADQLKKATYEMASSIAKAPPISLRMIKRGIYMGVDNDLNTQTNWEHLAFNMCRQTEDHFEGAKSFLENREPHFKGR